MWISIMEDDVKTLKAQLVGGLKTYFEGDVSKVKRFGIEIKALGLDLSDLETLQKLKARPEAVVTLLGLSDFGLLAKVINTLEYIDGTGNPDQFQTKYINIFQTK